MRVSVVIPTHNEAQSIGRVLADLPVRCRHGGLGCRQQFNRRNSRDRRKDGSPRPPRTSSRIRSRLFDRIGAASSPDIVVFLDGDYSDRADELPLLLAPIIDGHADITLGSRLGKQSNPGRVALASPRLVIVLRLS